MKMFNRAMPTIWLMVSHHPYSLKADIARPYIYVSLAEKSLHALHMADHIWQRRLKHGHQIGVLFTLAWLTRRQQRVSSPLCSYVNMCHVSPYGTSRCMSWEKTKCKKGKKLLKKYTNMTAVQIMNAF